MQALLRGKLSSDSLKGKEPFRATWAKSANLHITLNFLGNIDPTMVGPICKAMQDATIGLHSFCLTVGGLKRVPNINRPKTLWLGLKEGDGLKRLIELKERLDIGLRSLGLNVEERKYRPHMTLCRIRHREDMHTAGRITAKLIKEEAEKTYNKEIDFRVNSFVLFSSILGSGVALHTPLFTMKLASAAPYTEL